MSASGQVNNLHNLMNTWEFLGYGMLAVVLAALVSYPFAMNYAHKRRGLRLAQVEPRGDHRDLRRPRRS